MVATAAPAEAPCTPKTRPGRGSRTGFREVRRTCVPPSTTAPPACCGIARAEVCLAVLDQPRGGRRVEGARVHGDSFSRAVRGRRGTAGPGGGVPAWWDASRSGAASLPAPLVAVLLVAT